MQNQGCFCIDLRMQFVGKLFSVNIISAALQVPYSDQFSNQSFCPSEITCPVWYMYVLSPWLNLAHTHLGKGCAVSLIHGSRS